MSRRITIDGRMYGESGIGRYIRNLITQLQILDQENDYSILHLKRDYDRLDYRSNFRKVLADFPWYSVTEQIKLPGLLRSLKPELVHFPHFNVPIFYNGKFVVTIHDLIHQHFQMRRATTLNPLFYLIKQSGYKKIFKNAVRKSAKILVPSKYIKDLLLNEWKAGDGKVAVTYEAVDDKILELSKKLKVKKQLPYIFYVGNAHPHKNVEGLIRAFGQLKKGHPDLSLVLSGNDHYFWQRIRKQFQNKDIIYTGFVSDEELVGLYKNAQCFVLPSFEEGFGIPLLEAMACSCPVISSDKGSLPEIGGNACLYFDPLDSDDMAEKIAKVLKDQKLRRSLIEKGLKRHKEFSWRALAQKTLGTYLQAINL